MLMALPAYFDYLGRQADEEPLYVFDGAFGETAPQLLEGYQVPLLFAQDYHAVLGSRRPEYRWLVMGPGAPDAPLLPSPAAHLVRLWLLPKPPPPRPHPPVLAALAAQQPNSTTSPTTTPAPPAPPSQGARAPPGTSTPASPRPGTRWPGAASDGPCTRRTPCRQASRWSRWPAAVAAAAGAAACTSTA
jgi:hypothetical protein